MEILGYQDVLEVPPSTELLLTRKAYMVLATFGLRQEVEFDEGEIIDGVELDEDSPDDSMVVFTALETDTVYYGDNNEFSVQLDQFPYFSEKVSTDMGYVVLHIASGANYEYCEQQQFIFRLETHSDGPAIFVGSYDAEPDSVDQQDLFKVYSFLQFVEDLLWVREIADFDSTIHSSPAVASYDELSYYLDGQQSEKE